MTQYEWRIRRKPSNTVETDLYDLRPLTDAFQQFASSATVSIVDADGTKVNNYPRFKRVEFQYSTDGGSTWSTRAQGIVTDRTRNRRDGLPQLDLDIVGNDHLLRRRKVYKSYASQSISAILNDLITNFTAVSWDASQVSVQNDNTISREFSGVKVDNIIDLLSSESANEEWGVDTNLTFYFRQQDTTRASPLTTPDIFSWDLPRTGKRSINRFKLFYGPSGNRAAVVVEDPEAQQKLKDELGTSARVVISDSDTKPEITDEDRAEAVARKRLGERSDILTGTVSTFGRFATESGDVLELDLPEAGINSTDFRVAQAKYYYQRNETELTVAENRGNVDDLLIALSDDVSNVRAREADPDATETRFLDFQSGVELSTSVTVRQRTRNSDTFTAGFGDSGSQASFEPIDTVGLNFDSYATSSVESTKSTRALLNACRDVWQGESAPGISHFGVGTDDGTATRADNSLISQLLRVDTMTFTAGNSDTTFKFDGHVSNEPAAIGMTLREAMFFNAASGNAGYLRTTFDDITHDGTTQTNVRAVVTISNDSDQQGVITDTGQKRLRDLLIGETGHEPTDMVYGTGTTAANTSDTSLGSKVHEDDIDSTADRSTGVTDIIERMGTGEVNGNDIAEIGEENAADELLSRIVFDPRSKTSDFELETNHRFKAQNA